MRLYQNQDSGNCYKVRLLLAHLDRAVERVELSVHERDNRPEAVLRGSPLETVPVLELDDGTALGESNAILGYLAAGTPYLPSDPLELWDVQRWLFFEQNAHEANVAVVRYWVHLAQAPEKLIGLEQRQAAGRRALAAMERQLERTDFLAAGRYTIADIALYAYTHVAHEGGFDLEPLPALRAWLGRVREQPGHIPMDA